MVTLKAVISAYGGHGFYPTDLLEALRKGGKAHRNDMPCNIITQTMISQYIKVTVTTLYDCG